MKKLIVFSFLLFAPLAVAQYSAGNGNCALGGQSTVTQGFVQAGTVPIGKTPANPGQFTTGSGTMASYPKCTVTVYLTGTQTKATLYNSATGGSLTNPFTANTDSSFTFYVQPECVDVTLSSGSTTGSTMPVTKTIPDICPGPPGQATGAVLVAPTGTQTITQPNGTNLSIAGQVNFPSIAPVSGKSCLDIDTTGKLYST